MLLLRLVFSRLALFVPSNIVFNVYSLPARAEVRYRRYIVCRFHSKPSSTYAIEVLILVSLSFLSNYCQVFSHLHCVFRIIFLEKMLNLCVHLNNSQVDPIVASFSGGAVGVISALMVVEVNNVKQQEHKRCKYCLGTGIVAYFFSFFLSNMVFKK